MTFQCISKVLFIHLHNAVIGGPLFSSLCPWLIQFFPHCVCIYIYIYSISNAICSGVQNKRVSICSFGSYTNYCLSPRAIDIRLLLTDPGIFVGSNGNLVSAGAAGVCSASKGINM